MAMTFIPMGCEVSAVEKGCIDSFYFHLLDTGIQADGQDSQAWKRKRKGKMAMLLIRRLLYLAMCAKREIPIKGN